MQAKENLFIFPLGSMTKITYPKTFRKSIHVLDSNCNDQFSFFDLTNFLLKIPTIDGIICKKSKTQDRCSSVFIFHIYCSNCEVKLFRIVVDLNCKKAITCSVSICCHIQIERISNIYVSFCFNKNKINAEALNSVAYHTKHPLRVIGKFLFKREDCDMILKKFLHPLIYTQKSLYLHHLFSSNSNSLESIMNKTKGHYFLLLYKSSISENNLLVHNDKQVQYLVWIAPWCKKFLEFHSGYIQIDASFYALHPYVYSVPLLILDNAAIPLGIVLGPQENNHLFNYFYDFVGRIYPSLILQLKKMPILSDEGSAIKLFAQIQGLIQFFCYRHLIEKLGSNSILGEIARFLLFQPTKKHYNKVLPQVISDVNEYISESLVKTAQVEKFRNIFEFKLLDNKLVAVDDHQHGIWHRMEYGISTCSNHIERLHRTLNEAVSEMRSIYRKLDAVLSKLFDYFNNFSTNSRNQAIKLLNKFKKKKKKHNFNNCNECPHQCGWSNIYSNRFGIPNFPCIHTALSFQGCITKIPIPDNINLNIFQLVTEKAIENIKFSSNKKETTIKYNFTEDEMRPIKYGSDEFRFLVQTSREILAQKNQVSVSKKFFRM